MFYFYSLIAQFTGLVGAEGILPLTNNLDGLRRAISRTSGAHLWILRFVNWIWSQPSFQTNPSKVAEIGCSLSVFTAVLVYYDFRWLSAPCFVLLFLLYFSVKHVGRTWLNFQWDILVLESGFFAPLLLTQSVWALGIFQFLVVKVMWGSGICKITSGCPKWADGSAMEYHYWTTCLPAPLSYYFHYYTLKFAPWASRIQVWTTLFIQIVATVLATTTPFLKTIAFALDTLLMIAIGVTGNYGPFGLQTCALATSLLQFGDCGSWALMDAWDLENFTNPFSYLCFVAFALYVPASYSCMVENLDDRGPEWLCSLCRWCYWHLRYYSCCYGYGLFASMTTFRHEVIFEERHNDKWVEVKFPFKPGELDKAPTFIQNTWFTLPRLDWRLWFVPLGGSIPEWLFAFVKCLHERKPTVMELVLPVPAGKPTAIRASLYDYRFTFDEHPPDWEIGSWWRRKHLQTLFILQ
eukprot:GEMP01024288.1.p1 GENE.GEMP01024288.1~~GEMP01024288.1.p1  ORF type:complete len:465 (+),score=34.59 GEMP01024288.1:296-1690(+)